VGFKNLFRRRKNEEPGLSEDIDCKLQSAYPEVSYLSVLLIAMAFGMAGIGARETYTTPAVVIYGVAMALICMVPVGLVYANDRGDEERDGEIHRRCVGRRQRSRRELFQGFRIM